MDPLPYPPDQKKPCSKCKRCLPLEEFCRKAKGEFGRTPRCRACLSETNKASYQRRREKVLAYALSPEVVARAAARRKERYRTDPVYRERQKARDQKRRQTPRHKATRRLRSKRMWAENAQWRVRSTLHKAIRRALKGVGKKSARLHEIAGCDLPAFMRHMEGLFKPGMTWDNHGVGHGCWHIDHVRPVSSFDLSDPEQVKVCFHWSNMQPLWMEENLEKRDKAPEDVRPELLPPGFSPQSACKDSCSASSP